MWLGGVTLVDTPGVGGLDSAHGRVTLSAVKQAGALLFLSDGGQILTKPELDFLHQASQAVEFVVFALTKIDRTGAWEEVREENQSLLGRHAPRFADSPVFPVAAVHAIESWGQSPEDAEFLLGASRIADLAIGLQSVAANRSHVYAANALRAGCSGLEGADAALELELAAVKDPAVMATLEEERARQAEYKDRTKYGRLELDNEVRRLRHAAVTCLNDGCDGTTTRMTMQIGNVKGPAVAAERQFEIELEAELGALVAQVKDIVAEGIEQITRSAFAGLPAPHDLLAAHRAGGLPGLGTGSRARRRPLPATGGGLDMTSVAVSAFTGVRMAFVRADSGSLRAPRCSPSGSRARASSP